MQAIGVLKWEKPAYYNREVWLRASKQLPVVSPVTYPVPIRYGPHSCDRNTARLSYTIRRTTTGLGFKPAANWFAVSPTTQTLIRQVVDRFCQQMDRAIGEHKLRSTLVHRLEAVTRLVILPVGTTVGSRITTFPEPGDRVMAAEPFLVVNVN